MKKTIYHSGKEEGEYRVFEAELNEKKEIFLRLKHGVKGDKENVEQMTMRVGYDELAGFAYRLERVLMTDEKLDISIYHDKGEGKYKVLGLSTNEEGAIFLTMAEGVKGDTENRQKLAIRVGGDELAGLWFGIRRILLS